MVAGPVITVEDDAPLIAVKDDAPLIAVKDEAEPCVAHVIADAVELAEAVLRLEELRSCEHSVGSKG